MQFDAMKLDTVYFYTSTILKWKHLLENDEYKNFIISSLKHLVDTNKICVYGFVIMPNHIHLLWKMKELNGKESPHASFAKFTGHQFLEKLRIENPSFLEEFFMDSSTRKHHFWQRNSLPFEINSEKTFMQKLNYIHNNPLQDHWKLTDVPENYKYSSAKFYSTNFDEFGILSHW